MEQISSICKAPAFVTCDIMWVRSFGGKCTEADCCLDARLLGEEHTKATAAERRASHSRRLALSGAPRAASAELSQKAKRKAASAALQAIRGTRFQCADFLDMVSPQVYQSTRSCVPAKKLAASNRPSIVSGQIIHNMSHHKVCLTCFCTWMLVWAVGASGLNRTVTASG